MKDLNLKRSGIFEVFSCFQSGVIYDAIEVKIKMIHSTNEEKKEKGFNKSTLKKFIFFYLFFFFFSFFFYFLYFLFSFSYFFLYLDSLFMVTLFCLRIRLLF